MLIEADLGYDLSEEIIDIIKKQSNSNSDLINDIKLHLKNLLKNIISNYLLKKKSSYINSWCKWQWENNFCSKTC